jgi:glycosyltransferase involved in cell wall biosynthesis
MRILFVNHTAVMGGAEHSLLELARALPAQGVDVSAALPAGPLADALAAAGVTVHTLPLHRVRRPRELRSSLTATAALLADSLRFRRLLRGVRPDLVHANSAKAALFAAPAARSLGIPCLWHCRDLAPPAARLLTGLSSAVVAVSDAVARSLPPSPKLRVIPNGIDLTRFDPERHSRTQARAALAIPSDATLVLMVADFVPWKRHDLFLAAAAAIRQSRPDAVFAVAGRDRGEHPDLAVGLRAQADALGLADAVRWLGHCPDTAPLYAVADILLHPPACEPFGRVVCEALAMNCPVVVADSGGPAEIAADCPAAIRVPPGSASAFAAAGLDLLGAPRPSSRPHIVQRYDIRRAASDLVRLYERVGVRHQDKR